jgi:uncharacterized protein YndB with AHSA1/START domain
MMPTLIILVVVVGGLLAYVASRPDTFRIERSVTISAPPEKLFPLIADLHAFNTWNPFAQGDPTMQLSYSGSQSGVGAAYGWTGGRSGAGNMTVTEATAPSSVAIDLNFLKPMVASNKVVFSLTPTDNGTDVSWAMSGTYAFTHKLFGLVFNSDKMVGGEFEKGLASLKTLAEG